MSQHRGITLRENRQTRLWEAEVGGQILRRATSGALARDIDALLGPEVRECCTGEASC